MQFVADILPARVERPASVETTAWGAAYVAGLTRGVCAGPDEMMARWRPRPNSRRQCRRRARGALCRLAAGGGRRAGGGAMNLPLRDLPDARAAEIFEALFGGPGCGSSASSRRGSASPAGFWYDQADGELVLLLAGAARLRFEDEARAAANWPRRLARHAAASPPPGRLDRPRPADGMARRILRRVAAARNSPTAAPRRSFGHIALLY